MEFSFVYSLVHLHHKDRLNQLLALPVCSVTMETDKSQLEYFDTEETRSEFIRSVFASLASEWMFMY